MPFYPKELWQEARNLVELNGMSPKEVAERLNISYTTLKQKSNSQKWLTKRRKKVLTRAGQFEGKPGKYELISPIKTARDILEEKIVETRTTWQIKNIERTERLAAAIEKTLDQCGELVEPSDLSHLVKSHNALDDNARRATGLSNTSENSTFNNIAILNIPLKMLPKAKDLSEDNFVQID